MTLACPARRPWSYMAPFPAHQPVTGEAATRSSNGARIPVGPNAGLSLARRSRAGAHLPYGIAMRPHTRHHRGGGEGSAAAGDSPS